MRKTSHRQTHTISRRKFLGQAATLSAFFIVPRHVLGGKGYTAPSDQITLGFIGTGRQGVNLLNSFTQTGEAQVIAACDVYAAKLQNFVEKTNAFYAARAGSEQYKGCDTYTDFRELLQRKDIDAIVIATPDHWHAVQAVHAAKAGKDIYCEKPLSLTIAEGKAMVKAVRASQCVFQTGSMQRSWPEFRQTVELIRNGYIGDIKTIKVSVGGPPVPYDLQGQPVPEGLDWDQWLGPNEYLTFHPDIAPPLGANIWARWRYYTELGGGDMTDWGAHMFDIVQWALDMDTSGPVRIVPPDGKDHIHLTFYYANGITMTHEHFGKDHAIRFIGTKGTIDVQRRKLETTPDSLKDMVITDTDKRVYKSENHYKDWLQAIRNRTQPICNVETGHRSATIGNLGNIAYALSRPLQWDPRKEQFKGDKEANKLLGRKMRPEWSLEQV